jgi:hypothetical protein
VRNSVDVGVFRFFIVALSSPSYPGQAVAARITQDDGTLLLPRYMGYPRAGDHIFVPFVRHITFILYALKFNRYRIFSLQPLAVQRDPSNVPILIVEEQN